MLKEQLLFLITTPIYMVVIGAEIILSNIHAKKYYKLKDTLMNVYLCLVNGGIDLLFRAVYLVILIVIYQFHIISWASDGMLYWFLLFLFERLQKSA